MENKKKTEGQLTEEEFKDMLRQAGRFRSNVDYAEGKAWIMYGKYTKNYYYQHSDGSWTNYDCKTS